MRDMRAVAGRQRFAPNLLHAQLVEQLHHVPEQDRRDWT
jgi:hypothetical protein